MNKYYLTTFLKTSVYIIESSSRKFIDMAKILPEKLPGGKNVFWADAGRGKIKVFCDKYGVRGGTPKPIVINRYIPLCEPLFEGLGLGTG